MKTELEKRKPSGPMDYVAIALTTFGVGYLPLAPGTWGSMVGVGIYVIATLAADAHILIRISLPVLLLAFVLAGIWAAGRSRDLLGNTDPSEAVVDEVMGQIVVFLFVPFGIGWKIILAGFILFRIFDIWKPYPIRELEILPGGLGICADDIVAGIYAGICLAVIYAASLSIF